MDLFGWSQLPSETDNNGRIQQHDMTTMWIPEHHNDYWKWGEDCSPNYTVLPVAYLHVQSAVHSPDSFAVPESFPGSSYDGSHFDGSSRETLVVYDHSSDAKAVGRPRAPAISGRDVNGNRIQRRRTQNRNSQRVYRQRRIDERNDFEARALAAEVDSEKLRSQVNELQSEVAELTDQIKILEAKYAGLRTGDGWEKKTTFQE